MHPTGYRHNDTNYLIIGNPNSARLRARNNIVSYLCGLLPPGVRGFLLFKQDYAAIVYKLLC